jgi:hypothetical protein
MKTFQVIHIGKILPSLPTFMTSLDGKTLEMELLQKRSETFVSSTSKQPIIFWQVLSSP